MSETLIPPFDTDDEDPLGFDLDAFDENNPGAFDELLRGATSDRKELGFADLPVSSPYDDIDRHMGFVARKVLPPGNKPENSHFLQAVRSVAADTITNHYGDHSDAAYDAKIVADELAANTAIHGGHQIIGGAAVAGFFTVYRMPDGIVVFEAANVTSNTEDAACATERDEDEGGRGFDVIASYAEEHGGKIGRFKLAKDRSGEEIIVANPEKIAQTAGRWVVYATFDMQQDSQTLAV